MPTVDRAEGDDPLRGLGARLHHFDPEQLWYQFAEIVVSECYVGNGVEVRPSDVVFDVGANVGVASAYFAVFCEASEVHSFEPVAPLFEVLQQNVSQFDACRAHDYGLAATERTGVMTFYPKAATMSSLHADPDRDRDHAARVMGNGGMNQAKAGRLSEMRFAESTRLDCAFRTLSSVIDEEEIERIDLLKIDVEGAEQEVLAGIEDADWPRIRQVSGEVHSPPAEEAIRDELRRRGFRVVVEQDDVRTGTDVKMIYATRR